MSPRLLVLAIYLLAASKIGVAHADEGAGSGLTLVVSSVEQTSHDAVLIWVELRNHRSTEVLFVDRDAIGLVRIRGSEIAGSGIGTGPHDGSCVGVGTLHRIRPGGAYPRAVVVPAEDFWPEQVRLTMQVQLVSPQGDCVGRKFALSASTNVPSQRAPREK